MKNREKLNNMALYDLLRKIEDYVNETVVDNYSIGYFCIQQVFDVRFYVVNEIGMSEHCCPYADSSSCEECLQKWLNEEVEKWRDLPTEKEQPS